MISLVHRGERPREFPAPAGWVAIGLMIGAMGIDGVSSYAGFATTTNDLRLITGLLAGYAIAAMLAPMLNDEFWRTGSRERVLDPAWRLLVWLATVPVAFVVDPLRRAAARRRLSRSWSRRRIIATLTAVNLVMVCLAAAVRAQGGSHHRRVGGDPASRWRCRFLEIWLSGLLRLWLESMASRLS